MKIEKIALASDHAGYSTKQELLKFFAQKGIKTTDFGTFSTESADYPDYAHPLAEAVENKHFDFGISLCGSGNGINMTVNKHQKIRAALCWTAEIAKLARLHNNANICSIPARFVTIEEAIEIVEVFLTTEFEGGRHTNRINKIPIPTLE